MIDFELADLLHPAWMHEGACVGADPAMFFPRPGVVPVEARELCRGCPVQATCLEYALSFPSNHDHGVWGGTTERERRRMRQRRAA